MPATPPPLPEQDAELIANLREAWHAIARKCYDFDAILDQAIARIQSQPATNEEGWVKLSERKPTKEDAIYRENIEVIYPNGWRGWDSWKSADIDRINKWAYWRRLPPPPKEPSPEEIQAQDDEKAFEATLEQYRKRSGWAASEVKEFWNAALAYDRKRASARRATT
ncbi:MAG: hypothetical protein JSR30_00230 [Proteobacteria bacterium]|nr:hypothetical protein [Pseudomonadota bacterium]